MVLVLAGIDVRAVLGMMMLYRWPVSRLWAIRLFVSIELIVNGWSTIILALAAKNAERTDSPSSALGADRPWTRGQGRTGVRVT